MHPHFLYPYILCDDIAVEMGRPFKKPQKGAPSSNTKGGGQGKQHSSASCNSSKQRSSSSSGIRQKAISKAQNQKHHAAAGELAMACSTGAGGGAMQLGSLLRDAVADLAEANIKIKPSVGGSSSRRGQPGKKKSLPNEPTVLQQHLMPVPIVTVSSGAMPAVVQGPTLQPQRHGISRGEEMSDLLNGFKL